MEAGHCIIVIGWEAHRLCWVESVNVSTVAQPLMDGMQGDC